MRTRGESEGGAKPGTGKPGPAMAVGVGRGAARAEAAGEEAAEQALAGLAARGAGGAHSRVELGLVFLSPAFAPVAERVLAGLRRRLGGALLVGVSGGGTIAGAEEDEHGASVSVLAASWPGLRVTPFAGEDLPLALGLGRDGLPEQAEEALGGDDLDHLGTALGFGAEHRGTLIFADPFTTHAERLLSAVGSAWGRAAARGGGAADGASEAWRGRSERAPIIGGLASASTRPRGNALILGDTVRRKGLVGVSLSGPIRVDALVSQGCRAFGPNLVITRGQGQLIEQLGGRPALEVLHEAVEALGPGDRALLGKGLFLGRVVNEYKDRFGRDDYLIRPVVGVMKDDRALAVGEHVRVGQTVRFHLRDARTAAEDLGMLMDGQGVWDAPVGGVLVTCNARGSKLFDEPSHDARAVSRLFETRASEPGEQMAKGGRAVQAPGGAGGPVGGAGTGAGAANSGARGGHEELRGEKGEARNSASGEDASERADAQRGAGAGTGAPAGGRAEAEREAVERGWGRDDAHAEGRGGARRAGALPSPLAGFFAAGEIGPVGASVFLHSHSAVMGLFRAG
jgi:small ligand-binding sensory domain FIST